MNRNLEGLTDPATVMREIVDCAGHGAEEVRTRWAREAASIGWNVNQDVSRYGVTPHVHDAAMDRLYREGDGFIFETLSYWITPNRQRWSQRGLARLQRHCRSLGIAPAELRLLMLGDGSASDTLLLLGHGFRPHYFDVPGSVTSAFSRARFAARGVAGDVQVIDDFERLKGAGYQALWCFDVIEHLPDMPQAIHDMATMLADGGIALITESCRHVRPDLPTHLEINRQYDGRVPALFQAAGLSLQQFTAGTDYRPCEYRKDAAPSLAARLRSAVLGLAVARGWWR